MGFWDGVKAYAADQLKLQLAELQRGSKRVRLGENTLNRLIAKAVARRDDIEQVEVAMHGGWMQSHSRVISRWGPVQVEVAFVIERLQVDADAQVVELRQRGPLKLRAQRMSGRVVFAVLKAAAWICRRSLLEWGVRGRSGLSVQRGVLVVELAELGATELVLTAAKAQAGALAELAGALLESGTEQLLRQCALVDARCLEGALEVDVRFGSGS